MGFEPTRLEESKSKRKKNKLCIIEDGGSPLHLFSWMDLVMPGVKKNKVYMYHRRERHIILSRCRHPTRPVFLNELANASGH